MSAALADAARYDAFFEKLSISGDGLYKFRGPGGVVVVIGWAAVAAKVFAADQYTALLLAIHLAVTATFISISDAGDPLKDQEHDKPPRGADDAPLDADDDRPLIGGEPFSAMFSDSQFNDLMSLAGVASSNSGGEPSPKKPKTTRKKAKKPKAKKGGSSFFSDVMNAVGPGDS